MNSFIKYPFHPWGLLSSIHLCCPRLTPLLQPSFLTASLLEILAVADAIFMEDGVPTSSTTEGIGLLHLDLISAASLTPPTVTVAGKAIGSATEGRIHVANCAKLSAIQPLTALNSNIEAMGSSLVQI